MRSCNHCPGEHGLKHPIASMKWNLVTGVREEAVQSECWAMFGGFGVGLFARAGWIPQEQELGAEHTGRCFRAHQKCLYGSKHREAPMLSDPEQLQDPKEKPGSTGALEGTLPTMCISKGTGMSHTGKLFSRINSPSWKGPTTITSSKCQLVFLTGTLMLVRRKYTWRLHTVLLPVISTGRQTAAKIRSKTTGRSPK